MPKRILIVEDEDAMAHVLINKFEHSGFEAPRCSNGNEAIEFMGKEKVDLVILDLFMPGKDGFGVLEERGATLNAKTPILVLTNLAQSESLKRAKDLGALDCLIKAHTSLNDLVERVKKEVGV